MTPVSLDEEEPRFASEHVLDNLGVPDDAGPYAAQRILRDNRTISQLRSALKATADALRYARPLIEKYGWTQGDSASFHRGLVEPIDAALALTTETAR
jgi:hypothetical protein